MSGIFMARFGKFGLVAVSLLVGGSLLYGGNAILNATAERTIGGQAERAARAWADYVGSEMDRIGEIASGAAPTQSERKFLERLRNFGDVFRFQLFDAKGHIRLISDELNTKIEKAGDLGEHNPKAASVIATGKAYTSIEDGRTKPDRPDVYVESYVPVVRDGKIIAIVEVYVDQTAQAAAVRADFRTFGIRITGLTLLALILPFSLLVVVMRRQRLQNVELEIERDKALSAQKVKAEFLANMSHEIRTPLNGVLGMAGLLAGTKLTDDQQEYTETIVHSGESLLSLLNDILDFSKIEAGKIDLENSVFDTVSLLDTTVSLLSAQAHSKGLELPTYVAPDVPGSLVGDDGRIRQILLNLIGNAIKFTETGGVSVEVSVESSPDEKDSMLLRFEIGDTGIGIPEEVRGELFNQFYQVDGSHKRNYEGTGLGLAISKHLTHLMGGQIGVVARESGGSVFWFTVRVTRHDVAEGWATDIADVVQGLRFLVVDDNAVNRMIFERQLVALGASVTTAINAESGLAKFRDAIDAGQPFDGGLIDHCMPGTDGIDLVKMMRDVPGGDTVRLIFSSSAGQYNSDQAVKPYGFDASLPKPLRPGSLLRCASRVFNRAGSNGALNSAADSTVDTAGIVSGRILVAEDNHVNQKLMRVMLSDRGYSVMLAGNGLEAVDAARKLPFDLILMDIKMPQMDGFEATDRIRQLSNENRQIPIIGVTANAMKGDRERVIQAGMNDYLSKPINSASLMEKIDFWLGRPKDERPGETERTDEAESNRRGTSAA